MPDGPSTMTSRTSAAVSPTTAMRRARPDSASARMNSAAARVLPAPRPAWMNHTRQGPAGGSCIGRAQKRHS
jgi:hypothetical protein